MSESNPQLRPRIGLTIGDPLGIGTEVVVKALLDRRLRQTARFAIYGTNETLTYLADQLELTPFWYRVQHDSERAKRPISEDVVIIDFDECPLPRQSHPGPSKAGGLASKLFVEHAIEDAMRPADDPRHLDAVVTAPISKTSWQMAGYKWPGHTELFAHRTRTKRHAMMFVSPQLRVVLATAHIGLMQLRDALNIGAVFDPIDLGAEACRLLGDSNPRIAVAGLNPHAGEQGQFGTEESRIIEPAIDMARELGLQVTGPCPGDTVFNRAVKGEFDLVVAMYHDQGLIPVKLLAWEKAVNWTIGLPIIRTSPDHGTAFDIAGKGKADAMSMQSAIELAVSLAIQKKSEAPESKSGNKSPSRFDKR